MDDLARMTAGMGTADAAEMRRMWALVDGATVSAEAKAEARRAMLRRMRELGMDTAGMEAKEGVAVLSGAIEGMVEDVGGHGGPPLQPGGGRVVEVTIIRAGESNNRLRYRPELLAEAATMFEGAAAFCDHPGPMDEGRAGGRSLRDLVGVYEGVQWDAGTQAVRGRLRLYPGADWLAALIREAVADRAAGRAMPNFGISADMMVMKSPIIEGGQPGGGYGYGRLLGWEVKRVVRVNSADVVFMPSAGGKFERIVEGVEGGHGGPPLPGNEREGEVLVCVKCNKEICECQGVPATEGAALNTSSVQNAGDGETRNLKVAATGPGTAPSGAEITRELEAVRSIRQELCRTILESRLGTAGLPVTAADWLRGRFKEWIFEASELDAEITSVRGMLGGLVAPGVVRGMGPAGARIEGGMSEVERVQLAVDRLFGLPLPDAQRDIPRLSGIREAYLIITGDTGFKGSYDWSKSHLARAFEANEVTTSVMANIVANSMTKKLVADYKAQPKWWLPFVTRTAIRDMKVQDRIRLYDFAVLPTVNEDAAYVNLAWDDIKETYTPAKKGSVVYVTLETIINDDLRAVAHIPSKLAAAAAVTINEFISGLFTANSGSGSTMVSDSVAVFHADHGGNLGSTALSSAALRSAMIVLAKMTNSASKRIGVVGKYLLVPPDLMYTAQVIAGTSTEPGTANNDMNPLAGHIQPITVPQWTDANNWYLLADPAQIESIELGFLNGREEPELLVQDNPTSGTVFTNDAISYKVRWIFGGGWLDYRGAFGAVVA